MLMNFHRPSTALSYANVQRALLKSAAIAYVTLCSLRCVRHAAYVTPFGQSKHDILMSAQPHSTSLHLTPPNSTSLHLTPPHSTSLHLTPPHSTSLHLTPPHSTSLHLTPPHSTSKKGVDRPVYYYYRL